MLSDVPIFILCGGLGTRLKEETELRPKPMVPVGEHPMLLHIMRYYASFGFRRFILCLGYRQKMIKEYFLNFYAMNSDSTVHLRTNSIEFHGHDRLVDWHVTLADTGTTAMTGARVARAARHYLGDTDNFGVTYGDGLTNADLQREWEFHLEQGKIGTVLGVNPPSRFGEFDLSGDIATNFVEKPNIKNAWINGGYFFFKRKALDFLSLDDSCVLEQAPLANLASLKQLAVFRHSGFWACMDTQRDRDYLTELWNKGEAPWHAP